MLQHNLIFGIQKKIKEGRAQSKSGSVALEESSLIENEDRVVSKEVQVILEGSLNAGIYQQTQKKKNHTKLTKRLFTESFTISKVQKKLNKDIVFFNFLYENFTEEPLKANFNILLESLFGDTIRLYQECDVTPRLMSPTLDSNEITESIVEDIYRNSLNESIKNNYTKPLLSGKINELYESEIRTLTKKLIQEGVEMNMDQVRIYLPFEESVSNFIREVIIPKTADMRVKEFMESVDSDYTDLMEESVQDILSKIEQKIKLLSSLISPNMFDKAVDLEDGMDIDAPKMAGITIAIDKSFEDGGSPCGDGDNDADDICPATAAAIDPEVNEELESENEAEAIDDEDEEIGADETEGAEELELPMEDGLANPENGMVTNDHDIALSGEGNDHGVLGGEGAELPSNVEPDATDEKIEAMLSDDVSEEIPSDEEIKDNEDDEDVSESKK